VHLAPVPDRDEEVAVAIEADARTYPAGSIVILRTQPYSNHVKDLFEVQRYPEGEPPYDVAGWTLPMLLGVRRVEVMQPFDTAGLKKVDFAEQAAEAFEGDPRLMNFGNALSSAHSSSWTEVFQRVGEGAAVRFATLGEQAGLFRVDAVASDEAGEISISTQPRIGLYSPWSGNMDEGWTRWVFDTWEIPYITVRNEQLRAGQLHDFIDVLILPAIGSRQLDEGRALGTIPDEYARGLAPEGAVALHGMLRDLATAIRSLDTEEKAGEAE
jgi:hypothetical protein